MTKKISLIKIFKICVVCNMASLVSCNTDISGVYISNCNLNEKDTLKIYENGKFKRIYQFLGEIKTDTGTWRLNNGIDFYYWYDKNINNDSSIKNGYIKGMVIEKGTFDQQIKFFPNYDIDCYYYRLSKTN